MERLSIALVIPGGLGTGANNIGIPVLEQIVKRLSQNIRITVFQLFPVNKGYEASGFDLIPVYSRYPLIKTVQFFRRFQKEHRIKKFKAIHGYWAFPCGFYAVVVSKIFKIKGLVSLLGGDVISIPEINYGQLRNPIYRKIILWSLQKADEVVALTQYLVNNIQGAGSSRSHFRIIPWGIDIERFSFNPRELDGTLRFLHVANLHPVKDQTTLLRAFKLITKKLDAHLTIIGVGTSKQLIELLIRDLNLQHQVTFLTPVANNEMPTYYHDANILLHTSVSEGQSEVVTEAMCCGLLVCGTRVGLMHDLPDCCVTVPVRDFEKLADEVLSLIANAERCAQMRMRAKAWTESHSIDWTVGELTKLFY